MGEFTGLLGLLKAPRKHGQGLPTCPSPGDLWGGGVTWQDVQTGMHNTQHQRGHLRSCGLMEVPQREPFYSGTVVFLVGLW